MSYSRQSSMTPASWALVAITAWLCCSAHAASRQAVVLVVLPSLQWREAGPDHVSSPESDHGISRLDVLAGEQQLSLPCPLATHAAITEPLFAAGAAPNGRRALLAGQGGSSRPRLKNSCSGNQQVDPQTDAKAWDTAANLRQRLTSSAASFFSTLESTIFTTEMGWDPSLTATVAAGQPDAGAQAEPAGGEGSPGGVAPNALLDTTVYVQPLQMVGNAVYIKMASSPEVLPFATEMQAKVIQVTPLGDLATPLAAGEGELTTPGFSFKTLTPGAADGSGAGKGFNMIPADRTTVVPLGPDVKEELAVTEMLTGCTLVTAFDPQRQELHVTHIKPSFGGNPPFITGANMATLLQSSTLYFEGLPGVKANVFGRNGIQNGGYDEESTTQRATGFFMVAKTQDGEVAIVRQSTDIGRTGASTDPTAMNPMLRRTALQFPLKPS